MSFEKKSSFASGEVDQALQDITDIKSYYSGLSYTNNVIIGKNGRVLNSAGNWCYSVTDEPNANAKIYVPTFFEDDNDPYFLEFGEGYVKAHPLKNIKDQIYSKLFIFDTDIPILFLLSLYMECIGK